MEFQTSALTPAIQKAVGLVCLNEAASWIDHGVNQLIKDPVWTWGPILAKGSQLSAPAVGTKWSIADQFIRPSPSLNERAPTISFFPKGQSKHSKIGQAVNLASRRDSATHLPLDPLLKSWIRSQALLAFREGGGASRLTWGRWRKRAHLYLPNALLFDH